MPVEQHGEPVGLGAGREQVVGVGVCAGSVGERGHGLLMRRASRAPDGRVKH
jgi:hypothetical protein